MKSDDQTPEESIVIPWSRVMSDLLCAVFLNYQPLGPEQSAHCTSWVGSPELRASLPLVSMCTTQR